MKLFMLILMSLLLFGSTPTNEYKKLKYVYINSECTEPIKPAIIDNYKDCKKWREYTLDDINQYINLLKLDDFIKADNKNHHIIYYNDNYTIKRDRDFLNNVIKLHNEIAVDSKHSVLRGSPFGIIRFLLKYAIKHEDGYLFNALKDSNIVFRGSDYLDGVEEGEIIVPLLLNFPNIDSYIPNDNGHASYIFDYWDIFI